MAVPQSAYERLMGMFGSARNILGPEQVPADADIMQQAQADARNQMLSQLGFGLLSAAIPQTAAQRTQALQQAFGGMGNMNTAVYNAAQARLMAQQIQDRRAAAARDAAFMNQFAGGQPATAGEVPSIPSASVAPATPAVPPAALPEAAERLTAPAPATATPSAAQAPQPQMDQYGLLPSQSAQIQRMIQTGVITDAEQLRSAIQKFATANAEEKPGGEPTITYRRGLIEIKYPNGKIEYQPDPEYKARVDIQTPAAKDAIERAGSFSRVIPSLGVAEKAVQRADGGYGDIIAREMSKWAPILGVPASERGNAASLINAAAVQIAPLFKQPGSTANYEMQLYMQAGPMMGDTKEANLMKIAMIRKLGEKASRIADAYQKNIGSPDLQGTISEIENEPTFTEDEIRILENAIGGGSTPATTSGQAGQSGPNRQDYINRFNLQP